MADVHELLDTWIANVKDEELLAELNTMKEQGDEDAITDAFFQDLAFGTAGLRGTIGAGTNRMNIYTVGRATQGFADYLNATFKHPTVAIARDSRNKGELFVKTTAAILAANGVTALVYPKISPVPTLSWAVRDLKCSGGICMTASHNPAPYNGYKAYGPDFRRKLALFTNFSRLFQHYALEKSFKTCIIAFCARCARLGPGTDFAFSERNIQL